MVRKGLLELYPGDFGETCLRIKTGLLCRDFNGWV